MAYIEPNSVLKLYRGINIDKSYENTLYFANINAQELFFHVNNPHLKWTLPKLTFQRVSKGTLRIEKPVHDIYDCNYMAFQNTAYGSKWFYAFITNVEYVNDVTTEITYELDVIQSYIHEVTIEPCFVEREHSATDNVGDNLLDENLETGDYRFGDIINSGQMGNWGVLVQSPYNYNLEPASGGSYASIPNGNHILVFRSNEIGYFTAWISQMSSEDTPYADSITVVSAYPDTFMDTNPSVEQYALIPKTRYHKDFSVSKPTKLGNYTPRNKKLLTYPYTYLGVTTSDGTMGEYKYEFFDSNTCVFRIMADPNTITFALIPKDYNMNKSLGAYDAYNTNEMLTMSNVPLASYQTDTWKIWFGQNKVSVITGATLGIIGGASAVVGGVAGGVATANPLLIYGGVASGIGAISNSVSKIADHKAIPNYVKGSVGSGIGIAPVGDGAGNTQGFQDFMHTQVFIHEEFARTIDSFFDMFGYATKEIKVPNTHVRKEWTYTKTIDCIVKCGTTSASISHGAPASVLQKIEEIFDSGIRFWVNNDNVGNFLLDNSTL